MDAWERRLHRIANLDSETLSHLREGATHVRSSGIDLSVLEIEVADERYRFALVLLADAKELLAQSRPRSAISRAYYALYHSIRALAFLANSGDDYQNHSELPKGVPDAFSAAPEARALLKRGRLLRNQADYDAYPRELSYWLGEANKLLPEVESMLLSVKLYIRSKGGFP